MSPSGPWSLRVASTRRWRKLQDPPKPAHCEVYPNDRPDIFFGDAVLRRVRRSKSVTLLSTVDNSRS